ncbi:patatin-like phospholipase family protein [Calothrix sp. 336/3]|uniref:patatin-like phospholipase family protein n=1 Tax=Calothrix sp. 336/3 TaxID=1337936 RepID=UPI00054EFADC|nr:patatin-like phospholipase family protein [Calothrix sp. 336/3]AKG22549.1 patatin [Calothrix sp. 336/3]
MPYKYKILSIDGGGIRGIIPAMVLAEVEKRTGKHICQLFDLIAGTSTGGILGMALTKPHPERKNEPQYTAKELIEMYRHDSARIFDEPFLEGLVHFDDIVGPKFPSQGRNDVLTQYLGDTQINEALTNIFVTSYDIELRMPIFFTKNDKNLARDNFRKLCQGYTMKQAAMATSAAPTYFEPYKVPTTDRTDNGYYSLVDGGVFANNPTSLAIMEAIINSKQKHKETLALNEILVISLGTGSLTRKYPYEQAKEWGLLGWIAPLINIIMDAASESVACQLEQLLPKATAEPQQYYRFQPQLNKANDDMDDVSRGNIYELETLGKLVIQQNSSEIDELCEQLMASWQASQLENNHALVDAR